MPVITSKAAVSSTMKRTAPSPGQDAPLFGVVPSHKSTSRAPVVHAGHEQVHTSTKEGWASTSLAMRRADSATYDQRLNKLEEKVISMVKVDEERDAREQCLNKFIAIVVVLNALMMWLELDYGPGDGARLEDRLVWIMSESIFTVLFIVEVAIRMYWERAAWIKSWWNLLDFAVVTIAVVETWIIPFARSASDIQGLGLITLTRFVRLVRLVRVVRLVRMFRSLYVMVMAFKHAMAGIMYINVIMMSGLFVCAIFTTTTIGKSETLSQLQMGSVDGKERFGTVPRSMYSLFELMTLEGWEEVGRPLVQAEPTMALFLIWFILVFTFGLLNMIVAVVVEKTLTEARKMEDANFAESRRAAAEEIERMKSMFLEQSADCQQHGIMSRKEFIQALYTDDSHIRTHLDKLSIPTDDAEALFRILDSNGDEQITMDEFLDGCGKIKYGNHTSWDMLALTAHVGAIERQCGAMRAEVGQLKGMLANLLGQPGLLGQFAEVGRSCASSVCTDPEVVRPDVSADPEVFRSVINTDPEIVPPAVGNADTERIRPAVIVPWVNGESDQSQLLRPEPGLNSRSLRVATDISSLVGSANCQDFMETRSVTSCTNGDNSPRRPPEPPTVAEPSVGQNADADAPEPQPAAITLEQIPVVRVSLRG